jgi:hypothetical protein
LPALPVAEAANAGPAISAVASSAAANFLIMVLFLLFFPAPHGAVLAASFTTPALNAC